MNKKVKIVILLVVCAAAVVAWSFMGREKPPQVNPATIKMSDAEAKEYEAQQAAADKAAESAPARKGNAAIKPGT